MLRFFLFNDAANRGAYFFVGTMNTADPAAGSAFAFGKIVVSSEDAPSTCLVELGVFDPADPFITRKRCDIFPCCAGGGIVRKSLSKIGRNFSVYCAS